MAAFFMEFNPKEHKIVNLISQSGDGEDVRPIPMNDVNKVLRISVIEYEILHGCGMDFYQLRKALRHIFMFVKK